MIYMKKCIRSWRKYCYIINPAIVLLTLIAFFVAGVFSPGRMYLKAEFMANTGVAIAAFLFTSSTIFQMLDPEKSIFAKNLMQSEHPKIFMRIIVLGILSGMSSVILYAFDFKSIVWISFVVSVTEAIMVTWYMYKIGKHTFRATNGKQPMTH